MGETASRTSGAFRYDPADPAFHDRIWDVYRTLRDEHPVYEDPERGDFAISRFADVLAVARDVDTFSSYALEGSFFKPMLNYLDPPRHSQLRSVVSRGFTPARIAALEPRVRELAAGLLDPLLDRDRCDFHDDFCAILPSLVIADMVGVPGELLPEFRDLATAFLVNVGEDYEALTSRIYALFEGLLAERRKHPADDLMTVLVETTIDGAPLSEDEILGFCLLLMVGGIDTTTNLLGNGIVLLARDPAARQALLADPSRWPAAIEEVNRVESPTQWLPRTARRDVEMHGVTIPEGGRVVLLWGSANHDEREFVDPERFDVDRDASRNVAFGFGAHFCLGAALARLEARVGFEEWHARFPDYELASEPERLLSYVARGYEKIPLAISPR